MSVSYPFTLSGDFPQGLRSDQLQATIVDTITTVTLLRIDTDGNDVDIVFQSALSGPEETTLNTLVANHVPNFSPAGKQQVNTTTTTDDTPTTISTISINTDNVAYISGTVIAVKNDYTQAGTWKIKSVYRNDGGTLNVVNSEDELNFADDPQWNVSMSVSGTDVLVNVTGISATTINWRSKIYNIQQF